MLELMAVAQNHEPPSAPKRNQTDDDSIPGTAVVRAGQKWLTRWRSSRQQRQADAEAERKDGALAASEIKVNGIVRRRTREEVQYEAETEHGSMSVSVPLESPEAKAFERIAVSGRRV
jgi:hypothetical protein